MRVFLFLILVANIQPLLAQNYYSKLLQKGQSAELAKSIHIVNDSTNIIQFIDHHIETFNYCWMLVDQNGDTLSTFTFKEPLLRSDGTNTLIISSDTVFQLANHRDSTNHIRVYATSLAGDSLFRRDYDWIRPDWLIVYPRFLYRRNNGEWLIVGTVAKGSSMYDVFAIHCAPDGTEIRRNVIVSDFEKTGARIEYLYAHNLIEHDSGYIISLRNWFVDAFSSSHILFVDRELNLTKRLDNAIDGLGLDSNPIDFTKDSLGIYFSSSRILEYEEIEAAGFDWRETQNPTMITSKLDLDGNTIWERVLFFPKGNWLEVFAGKTVANGDFVVCGTWQKSSIYLGLIARYSVEGDLLFCYGFPLHETPATSALWLSDFVEDKTGALTLVGELLVYESFTDKDIWLLRIPGYGCDPEYFDCSIDSVISSIKLIPQLESSAPGMTLYPNPIFPGQPITLELSGLSNGMAEFRWTDLQGKVVHQQMIEIYENAPSLNVPQNLGAGWYFVELRDKNGKIATAKVVVWERF